MSFEDQKSRDIALLAEAVWLIDRRLLYLGLDSELEYYHAEAIARLMGVDKLPHVPGRWSLEPKRRRKIWRLPGLRNGV